MENKICIVNLCHLRGKILSLRDQYVSASMNCRHEAIRGLFEDFAAEIEEMADDILRHVYRLGGGKNEEPEAASGQQQQHLRNGYQIEDHARLRLMEESENQVLISYGEVLQRNLPSDVEQGLCFHIRWIKSRIATLKRMTQVLTSQGRGTETAE